MRSSRRAVSRIRELRTELETLLFAKRKRDSRHPTRKIGSGNHSRFETLEQRVVLSATGLGFSFAPGTPQAYIDSVEDAVHPSAAENPGTSSPFTLDSRWSTTATNGSGLGQGDPTTLTWSIVPDGTAIPALGGITGESANPSDLVTFLGGIYGFDNQRHGLQRRTVVSAVHKHVRSLGRFDGLDLCLRVQ